jgi:NTP pyrophosphatase (non-canonical NTP hydrolase)
MEPQTLAMIKMEKNFIAVNQKGRTQYPYTDMTLQQLRDRLYQELDELDQAIETKDYINTQKECADVSNITDYIFEAVTVLRQKAGAKP